MTKRRYIQRDLEDQIREEVQAFINNSHDSCEIHPNQSLKVSSMSTENGNSAAAPKEAAAAAPVVKKDIKISEILELLQKGYVRTIKQDKSGKNESIQAYYGLTGAGVKAVFDHPKLKGRKTKVVSVNIIDDEPNLVPLTFDASRFQKKDKSATASTAPNAAPASHTAHAAEGASVSDSSLFR